MKGTIMHKHVPVVDVDYSNLRGRIIKIGEIYNIEHLPLGITAFYSSGGEIELDLLDEWWIGRSIPVSRQGVDNLLQNLELRTPAKLIESSYGLSLSDQYWLKPIDSDLSWEQINFFENEFSRDIGEILFGKEVEDSSQVNRKSPDNTSDGWLRKKWIIENGKRCLMKGGSGDYLQEPLNEAIASILMKRLEIPHVPYRVVYEKGEPFSICENFITPETELIPAWDIIRNFKKDNKDTEYNHLIKCCEKLGMGKITESIEKMLTVDYIINNTDRHYNNFGFIRNAEPLQWLGMAPIFDSGTSLWHYTQFVGKMTGNIEKSKPFSNSHSKQIKLVKNLDWFGTEKLIGIEEEVDAILSKSSFIPEDRKEKLISTILKRIIEINQLKEEYHHL